MKTEVRSLVLAGLCFALTGAERWLAPSSPPLKAESLGLTGLKASDCGSCHTAIYEEWKHSTHAAAWVDPQFQAEFYKDPEVGWLCLNCHTPISNQQSDVVTQERVVRSPTTTPNLSFDPTFRDEGVSCLACHWRADGIAVPHKGVEAPHATVYAPDLLGDQACTSCHQAQARLEAALVCHFDTAGEKERAGVQQTCTECHMPGIERVVSPGGPVRQSGAHTWAGSGLGKGLWEAHPGLDSLQVIAPHVDQSGRLSFELHNAKAGHMLPTGDPERYLRVTAEARDSSGQALSQKTWRIGQAWVWHPTAKKVEDTRLGVGERRRLYWLPKVKGTAVLLRVEHVRLNKENLDYHMKLLADDRAGPDPDLLRRYPTSRVLFEQEFAAPTR